MIYNLRQLRRLNTALMLKDNTIHKRIVNDKTEIRAKKLLLCLLFFRAVAI
jgi:hypothetical protein